MFGSVEMTIDKSLKVRRGATSSRSVLTRIERLEKLKEMDRWSEGDSPLGLAKVRVRKLQLKKKKKEKKEEETPAKGGKAAKGGAAKAAAPAKGGATKAAGKEAPKKKK
jgi:small basic protein (TIGR04137 family)